MKEEYEYDISSEVLELNSKSNFSEVDPLKPHYNSNENERYFESDYYKYPTQYYLKEIQWNYENNFDEFIILKSFFINGFYLKIHIENLHRVLDIIVNDENNFTLKNHATLLQKKLKAGQNYIDYYNLSFEEKIKYERYPKKWSIEERKKYILEHQLSNINECALGFNNLLIVTSCMEGLVSIYDTQLKSFSKYIAYRGEGKLNYIQGGRCGVSFYYRQIQLCYNLQAMIHIHYKNTKPNTFHIDDLDF